jgi:hypothetical protein
MIEWEKLSNFALGNQKGPRPLPPPSPVGREPEGERQVRSTSVSEPFQVRSLYRRYNGKKKKKKKAFEPMIYMFHFIINN